MLLRSARSQLLVIDIQEKLLPAISRGQEIARQSALLMQAAERLGIPILISEHNPKSLGASAATIRGAAISAQCMEKMHFSCGADKAIASHCEKLKTQGRDQLVLAGIEAHICVLQTALQFRQMGFEVAIVADAVSSFSEDAARRGLARAAQASCQIVDTEMVIFEWLHLSGTDAFRSLLDLIKTSRA